MPLITFPETRQSRSFDCGSTCVQSVLYYFGHEHRQDKLIEALDTSEEFGTRPGNIVKYFVSNGLQVHSGKMTIDQVKKYIDRGVPVMMVIQAWTDNPNEDYSTSLDDGHWVVAIGYDDESEGGCMLFEDPSLLNNRGFIPYDELDERWHDVMQEDTMLLDHYGIAVYGQKPAFNPNKRIKIESLQARVASRWLQR